MSCDVTADCPTGFFCRPLQSGGSACAAFAGDGDPCGGYTPVWAEMICAPDLVCVDLPPLVVDAPGVCRMPCAADAECPTDRYCAASSDVCRDDGACWDDLDCEQVGNSYVRPKCLGYGVCTAGSCSYECGDGACRDLANVFFGACEKVLGWAVVSGACLPVSGCDARGFTFFATASACSTQCGK